MESDEFIISFFINTTKVSVSIYVKLSKMLLWLFAICRISCTFQTEAAMLPVRIRLTGHNWGSCGYLASALSGMNCYHWTKFV